MIGKTKAKRGKLLAAVAVLAMVFAAFAVVSIGDDSDATGTQDYGGDTLSENQEFTNVNININKDLVINCKDGEGLKITGGSLTIAEGVKVTLKGGVLEVNKGAEDNVKVVINGTLDIQGGTFTTDSMESGESYEDAGITINGKMTVSKEGNFGATETVVDSGEGNLKTGSDAVTKVLVNSKGTLEVKGNAVMTNSQVDIAEGGKFIFNAKTASNLTVAAYGETSKNSTEIVSKVVINTVDTDKKTNLTFGAVSKSVTAYQIVTDAGTSKVEPVSLKIFNLEMNGTVSNASVELVNDKPMDLIGENYFVTKQKATEYKDSECTKFNGDKFNDYVKFDDVYIPTVFVESLIVKDMQIASETKSIFTIGVNTQVVVNGDMSMSAAAKKATDAEAPRGTLVLGGKLIVNGTLTTTKVNFEKQMVKETTRADGQIIMNGGTATVDVKDMSRGNNTSADLFSNVDIVGAGYKDEVNEIWYLGDLKSITDAALEAKIYSINLGALDGSEFNECKGINGYTIAEDYVLPDQMTLVIDGCIVIGEGVTFTISADATLEYDTNSYNTSDRAIIVDGTIVDHTSSIDDLEVKSENSTVSLVVFDVKSTNEEGDMFTYTTLENALKITTEGTIELYNGTIVLKKNMTIPGGVTVQFANGVKGTITLDATDKPTLTIDGILNLEDDDTLAVNGGKVIVNNLIRYGSTGQDNGKQVPEDIAGAYFSAKVLEDDSTEKNYIASVAVAAENAGKTGRIDIVGQVSMGDITFKKGEKQDVLNVYINNNYFEDETERKLAIGNITIDGATLSMQNGAFTGSVKSVTTNGETVFSFKESQGAIIGSSVQTTDDGEIEVTTISSGDKRIDIQGSMTMDSGYAQIVAEDAVVMKGDVKDFGKLTIGSAATLEVYGTLQLADATDGDGNDITCTADLEKFVDKYTTFALDGKVEVMNGGMVQYGCTDIDGELNVREGGEMNLSVVKNGGTITVDEKAGTTKSVELMLVTGKVVGKGILIEEYIEASSEPKVEAVYGVVIAAAGSDVTGAEFVIGNEKIVPVTLSIDLVSTVGADYQVFAENDTVTYQQVAEYIVGKITDAEYKSAKLIDAEGKSEDLVSSKVEINEGDAYSISLVPNDVVGKISAVSGMKIFIDNLDISNFWDDNGSKGAGYYLSVGTHTVTVQVQPGYEATPVITFNGQTVTDGKIVIEAGMEDFVLTATGDVTVDGGNGGSDSGMGITDYLLIILVVMVVILAIVVIMRMMRS